MNMSEEERRHLEIFCIQTTIEIHGLATEADAWATIAADIHSLTDRELVEEADWLDELLGK